MRSLWVDSTVSRRVRCAILEVHQVDRLADNGPDKIDQVAAVCPYCHRSCHYLLDRVEYNSALRIKIAQIKVTRTSAQTA